jgi:integrase
MNGSGRSGKQVCPGSRLRTFCVRCKEFLSCSSKDKKPPFSQEGLALPERDKLQMKIESREAVSFSWSEAKRIAAQVYMLDVDEARKRRYATVFLLAAATGLRCGELFALRVNDMTSRRERFV